MALAIMSFQTSRSRAADIISVTLPAPNQDFRLSSICLPMLLFLSSSPVVRKCSKPSLLITWPKNVAFLLSYLLHQWSVGFCLLLYHLISLLRCPWYKQHFFSGTTFLLPPIFSESACLLSMPHTRTSRSVGYSIEGLSVSSWALCCCWLGTVLAFGKFLLGLSVMIFLRRFYSWKKDLI